MPAISKIRLTNVVYEEGKKRYNDEIFLFDGHNGAILLENGGGKTVFIQTVLQAIIPHTDLAERKIKNTLVLENAPSHIAIEWLIEENPRRYVVTAVTLFSTKDGLDSIRYVYEYGEGDSNSIENIPFVINGVRPAEKGEILDYYSKMKERSFNAQTFATIKQYRKFLEEQYHIIAEEWESIVKINSTEGGVEAFFDDCKSTNQLFDRLLIPTVEHSIAGYHENMYADMFEERYEGLKQYKQLKETIEENKRIQAELDQYVAVFAKLHEKKQQYEQVKQKAKGIWEEVLQQKTKKNEEKEQLMQAEQDWKTSQQAYKVKKASYQIAVEKEKYEKLQKEYEEIHAKYSEKEEQLTASDREYQSLKYAKMNKELKAYQDELKFIEQEMEKVTRTEEQEELEYQLEEANRALCGYFMELMDQWKKEITEILYLLNPLKNEIETLNKQLEDTHKIERRKRNELAKIESFLETRSKDLDRLKQFLLANPEQQKVEEEYSIWQKRNAFLEEEQIRLKSELKQLEKEQQLIQTELETNKKEREEEKQQLKVVENELETLQQDQEFLIQQLGALRPQWTRLESIYNQETMILDRLKETIELLGKEKNALLIKERISHRFVDDYGNCDIFFSDPYVNTHLQAWKNQFDYCITGIEYLRTLNEQEYEAKKSYPLWAITLITTNNSKSQLQEKVRAQREQLHFPIQVLSLEEVKTLDERNDFSNVKHWIVPLHWEKGLDEILFQKWKETIFAHAKKATAEREAKEQEIHRWDSHLQAVQQFLTKHPFTKWKQLQESRSQAYLKIDSLSQKIANAEKELLSLQQKEQQMKETISEYQEEQKGLERKLEKALEYLQYVREMEESRKKTKLLNEEINQVEKQIEHFRSRLHELEQEERELSEQKAITESKQKELEKDEDYVAVKSLRPLFTEESKSVILARKTNIEGKLNKINKTYREWELKKEHTDEKIRKITADMELLRDEHPNILLDKLFPTNGDELLEKLRLTKEQLSKEIKQLNDELKQKTSAKDAQKGKWEKEVELFQKDFSQETIYSFAGPLEAEQDKLAKEKEELEARRTFLDSETINLEKELQSIAEAERELDRFIEKHYFHATNIEPILLTADEKMEFVYNRKKFVKKIIRELEETREQVNQETNNVNEGKQQVRQFCQSITDIKMRKMAENGVETKETYADLLDFRKNMIKRIEMITNYADESIRKTDAELQTFIDQIHNHVKNVAEELREIPKRTKVKVSDEWKTIYTFTIPEWEIEDGKKRIRDYIEWILNQLESDRYKTAEGTQDHVKVRKDIEMWLQSKQLLQIAMKNEAMKVGCRKVTNENKVTSKTYSWEQTNVWSGGEKWSKNMTLFLGILNYVAEKKKQKRTKLHNHRAVILDNPFGKASSDHVLSPVFFVAKQLGFQIIALTAHAEGKFLHDYFPIIYSCRLRETSEANKQVMVKEKWLHRAYFQDHDPVSIERLGETEQLSLFDL